MIKIVQSFIALNVYLYSYVSPVECMADESAALQDSVACTKVGLYCHDHTLTNWLNSASEYELLRPIIPRRPAFDLFTNRLALSQPATFTHTLNKTRLAGVSGGLVAANYYAYLRFKDIWWSHPTTSFHFYRGWRQTKGWYDFGLDDSLWHHMDKLGHYYNSRFASLLLSDTANWIGFNKNQSLWIGAFSSWLLFLQIELFDGQFEQWGFSLGDLAANTAGSFMPLLSERVPFFQNFQLKLSYHASAEIDRERFMVEDYAGMTFWLTTSPRQLLPEMLDRFWPDFLNFAFGYSVSQKTHGEVELYLGLDYDLSTIETKSPVINRLLGYLNYAHLPAPAIKIRPMTEYYFFYY